MPPQLDRMSPRQKTLALLTLVVALVLEIVDLTIVNTALPAIKEDFGAGSSSAQWIVAGYSLSFALLLLAGGRLGDSFGYRRVFLLGVAGFTLASLACGAAVNDSQLIAARILQGAAGAIMAPQFMAMMQVMFDPLERVAKLALFGVIGGLAAIAGPIIGGLLIEADLFGLGWRLIFLVNGPVGLAALAGGYLFLPDSRSSRPAGSDPLGMLLFGGAVAALMWPLMRGYERGWSAIEWACLAIAPLLCLLGWRHAGGRAGRDRAAIFDPALFAVPSFRLGLAISTAFSAANAGFLLVFAFALQAERGQSPLMTGLLHVPFGLGAMIGIGVIGRRFLPLFGRWILVAGAALMAVFSAAVLGGIGVLALSFAALVPLLIMAGVGMGMTSGCVPPVTVSQIGREHAGAAGGLLKTSQQLGSALGVALVGSVYFLDAGGGRWPASLGAIAALEPILLLCVGLAALLPRTIFGQPARA